jgi:Poly (ADP-ribose) glycohydrolase (PARG)
MMAAILIVEPLEENEALIITGAKPYSSCKGYEQDFEFVGETDPNAPCADVVIAIDAVDFSKKLLRVQYKQQYIDREILKAYAGFEKCPTQKIATGNWGGAAFQVTNNFDSTLLSID